MQRPLGAQISHMLKARGVEVIFGIPGVHNVEMYRGIEEARLTHILARHEQGAGFMADGYARATGKPGVAYVITGPGLTNIMTPMGQAWSDSVPLLVLASCLDETAARHGQLHQMRDQEAAAATVCDWSETARTPDAAYHLVDRALAEFRSARPRSKHISVPIAVLGGMAAPFPPARADVARIGGDRRDVADVAALIRRARRPLLVFGGGARQVAGGGADAGHRRCRLHHLCRARRGAARPPAVLRQFACPARQCRGDRPRRSGAGDRVRAGRGRYLARASGSQRADGPGRYRPRDAGRCAPGRPSGAGRCRVVLRRTVRGTGRP